MDVLDETTIAQKVGLPIDEVKKLSKMIKRSVTFRFLMNWRESAPSFYALRRAYEGHKHEFGFLYYSLVPEEVAEDGGHMDVLYLL